MIAKVLNANNKNNMKNRFKLIVTASIFAFSYAAQARENVGVSPATSQSQLKSVMSLCVPASAKADLDINNVRATLLTGGDMWWDLVNGKYLVPKPAQGLNGPTSIFAGSLWIGGIDASGTLKVAAQTYRQTGNDYWPGPLTSTATTDAATCLTWDKFYKLNKADVKTYIDWYNSSSPGANPTPAAAMEVINNWPSIGPEGQPMAPYYDANGNGVYDPYAGDYPDFWLGEAVVYRPGAISTPVDTTSPCDANLFGDQVLFWVFNDKGNVHTETGGASIGIEVQAQAFAFQTNDAINNMTFYHYKVINKSSFRLDSTFFGVWCDSDLGSASDDYVGCDVGLGLGYCYNGDLVDDNPPAGQIPYGINPPAIGIDFFEGPYADPNGLDDPANSVPESFVHYGNGKIDDERIGMKKFVYYNNDGTPEGNPNGSVDFYRYLNGYWRDGTSMTYGGTGHLTGVPCNYMFPGTSDQPTATSPGNFGTNGSPQAAWSEETVGNVPADRRFMESAGPFTLQAGAVNTVTTGVVWARATQGGNLASVTLMKGADAKAQDLFNNCFALLNGPDAPLVNIQELNNQLILTWTNPSTSNNANENYTEDYDKSTGSDSLYRFQGYMVYQLKDELVTSADIYDVDKARLVLQCDKTDAVKQIVNFYNDVNLQALVPQEMVNGADKGIVHSLVITDDKFATGNTRLVNHKTYYFAVVAYGYTPTLVTPNYSIPKDYLPFILGNKSADYFNHSAIPHIPDPEAGGTEAHSSGYGDGPKITRIEGHGNGGQVLDFTAATVSEIMGSATHRAVNPQYENDHGPINVKVVDPLNIPVENDFEFKLLANYPTTGATALIPQDNSTWQLKNLTTGEIVLSDKTIALPNEQIINGQYSGSTINVIPKWGISVNIQITFDPGNALATKNSYLESSISFTDNTKQWLTGLADVEGESNDNWIRSGTAVFTAPGNIYNDATGAGVDANQDFENCVGKTWAPYRICAPYATAVVAGTPPTTYYCYGAPAWPTNISLNKLGNVASIDVIFTSDKSQWTRCPVLEEQDNTALATGGAVKLNMRASASVDKQGLSSGQSGYNATEGDLNGLTGMGWFPGYAINLETGERLNMAFGEDSWLALDNGRDMKWNPTTSKYNAATAGGNAFGFYPGDPVFGGKHYIYVFGHNGDATYASGDTYLPNGLRDIPRYDEGKALNALFTAVVAAGATGATADAYKREIFTDAMWVNIPLLAPGHQLFETDVKVRLRIAKSYQRGYAASTVNGTSPDSVFVPANKNYPMYTFNTNDIETHKGDNETAKAALDLINIVPNPYYAYSAYEKKALENIVKITNLPEKCTVTIYTLNGTLIRKFNKDDVKTSLNWDLKNQARIPIASGMYIIYIKVPDVGEKTLKWFGVLRPTDLDSY
jgi:hypothetical protein